MFLLEGVLSSAGAQSPQQTRSTEVRAREVKPARNQPSTGAVQRRERSEAVLRAEGVPILKTLPVIETEKEAKRRTKEEIAYRALALVVVALKGEGSERAEVDAAIQHLDLEAHFTPQERAFLKDPHASRHDLTQFSWRHEGAYVLLWALGYIDDLTKPDSECDVSKTVGFLKVRNAKQFIAESNLRPLSEILDQVDRIYRYHWAVVDARVHGQQAPAGLSSDVVSERHYALNWLIGYMEQAWDDITTDT
jgi:hypothetical protein